MSAHPVKECSECQKQFIGSGSQCVECEINMPEIQIRDYTPQQFEKRFESVTTGGIPQSSMALARSAATLISGGEVDEAGFLAIRSQSFALEQDGAAFIAAAYWHLTTLRCPGVSIDFVLFMTGLSGGDEDKKISITDVEIAEAMNVSDKTIRDKRKALKAWMKQENYAVLEIVEGEYDFRHKKNAATRYRALISPIAAKIVLLARNDSLWRKDDVKAQKRALQAAAEEVQWENPEAPVPVKERKKGKAKTPDAEIKSRRKNLLTQFTKIIRLEYGRQGDAWAMWSELAYEMQSRIDEEMKVLDDTGGVLGMCRPKVTVSVSQE